MSPCLCYSLALGAFIGILRLRLQKLTGNEHSLHAQVCQPDGEVIITNDGATILNKMSVIQPAAKMLVELAKAQVTEPSSPHCRHGSLLHEAFWVFIHAPFSISLPAWCVPYVIVLHSRLV